MRRGSQQNLQIPKTGQLSTASKEMEENQSSAETAMRRMKEDGGDGLLDSTQGDNKLSDWVLKRMR